MDTRLSDTSNARYYVETWIVWPVYWSGIWVGALAAIATALIFGLVGIALGAGAAQTHPFVSWSN